jgi:hypothetical protein
MWSLVERPRKRRAMPHQVTFPVYREDQWDRMQNLLRRTKVLPRKVRFARAGMEMSFRSDEDAMLIKMAFNSS